MATEFEDFEWFLRKGRKIFWSDSKSGGQNEFDVICRAVTAKYRKLKLLKETGSARKSPADSRHDWLKSFCYLFVIAIIEAGDEKLFDMRIRSRPYGGRGRKSRPNHFQKGLLAIFAHDTAALPARDRERFGKQLQHAYRHCVPEPFLVGFLKQSKIPKIDRKTGIYPVDPNFADWIIQHLVHVGENRLPSRRGKYPRQIGRRVTDEITSLRTLPSRLTLVAEHLKKLHDSGVDLSEMING